MSSRYVMDFCPALLASALLAGAMGHRRWPRATLLAVILLVAADLSRVRQVPILNQATEVPYLISLAPAMGSTIDEYGGSYDNESHPAETEMWFNGFAIRRRAGEELVFLCFAQTVVRPDPNSTRYLHSVSWRLDSGDEPPHNAPPIKR